MKIKINKREIVNIVVLILVSIFSLTIGATAATTIAASQVTYNGTTVQEKVDELVAIANQCPSNALCSKAKIGDYVKMTPTQTTYTIQAASTGYDSDQTINPSELNLWRIIDIRTDGTIEMVSEYVSSTKVYFKGQQGYLNFVGTLNNIANQYGNSKYTIGARHMGYHGQTATITDTSAFVKPPLLTSSTSDNSNETVGGGDVMYEYDTNESTGLVYKALGTLKANKVGATGGTSYWLSSRRYDYGSSANYFWRGRSVYASGSVSGSYLYVHNGGWGDSSSGYALRPIVTLKSDVQATGSGTSASPWVLS